MTKRQRSPAKPRFEVYKDAKSEWRWRLVARNGRTIADSGEGYLGEQKCKDAVRRVPHNAEVAVKNGIAKIMPKTAEQTILGLLKL